MLSPDFVSLELIKIYYLQYKTTEKKLFREPIKSRAKFNITIGHQTCSAVIGLFTPGDNEELKVDEHLTEKSFIHVDVMNTDSSLALLEFDRPMYALPSGLLIGSRLDLDASSRAGFAHFCQFLAIFSSHQARTEHMLFKLSSF